MLPLVAPAAAWNVHGYAAGSSWTGGTSQGQSWFLQTGGDDPFINELKTAQVWTYIDNSLNAGPDELDVNGYPLYGSNGFSHGGFYTVFYGPSQAERPGNHIIFAGGAGKIQTYETAGGGTVANVSCQYTSNGGALTNGTYAIASGKASCDISVCTGTCTMRWVFSVSGESRSNFVEWGLGIVTSNSGNTLQNVAFIHADDESIFGWSMANWPGPNAVSHAVNANNTGEQFGTLYKQRVKQGGFGVWRFMDWMGTSSTLTSMMGHWADRKPTSYAAYHAREMRFSDWVGQPTYTLNGSSNDYAATLGSGPPTDRQIIIARWGTTATNGTITFNLNGTGALPVYTYFGVAIPDSSTYYFPTATYIGSLIFDAELNAWLSWSRGDFRQRRGDCK